MFLALIKGSTARQLYFTLGFFLLMTSFGFSQTCAADLIVEKNRSSKSVSVNGTIFKMVLTNTSTKPETYTIYTSNLDASCANSHFKKNKPNVALDVVILKDDRKSLENSEIIVRPGQSYKFSIKVASNKNTPIDSWGCIEVNAVAASCKTSASSVVLKSYVPDPEAN